MPKPGVTSAEVTGEVPSRVYAVARGRAQLATLSDLEREVAHALIDAEIARRVGGESFGAAPPSAS